MGQPHVSDAALDQTACEQAVAPEIVRPIPDEIFRWFLGEIKDLALPHRLHIVSNDYQFHADAEVVVIWERLLPQRAIGVRVMPDTPSTAWQVR